MTDHVHDRGPDRPSGFSVIELLIVVGIIGILAAVSLPAIGRYIRNYQIRAASQQVLGEIQAARGKAISKNVNFGVVFLIVNATQYQYVIEDDQNPELNTSKTRYTTYQNISTLQGDAVRKTTQFGPIRDLPRGVVFGTTCSGFTAGAKAFRFNRL